MNEPDKDHFRVTQYLLLQLLLTRARLRSESVYNAFVIQVDGTKVQLISASVSRHYLEAFVQSQQPRGLFSVRRSREYDWLEPRDRHESMVLFVGLIDSLETFCKKLEPSRK